MCGALKILVCVALVSTSTVSSNERQKRSNYLNLVPYNVPAPYQNNWALRANPNERVVPLYDVLKVNLNEQNIQGQSVAAEASGEPTSILNYASLVYPQQEESNRQLSTERNIQNGLGEDVWNQYGQRQPKISNGQVDLEAGINIPSNEQNQRLNSLSYGIINKGLLNSLGNGAQKSQSSKDLSANVAQDSLPRSGLLGGRNPLSSQIRDGYSSQLLRTGGLGQIPRSYGQDQGINVDLEGGRYQINLGAQNLQSGEDLSANVAQDSLTKSGLLGARNPLSSQINDGYSSQLLRTGGLRQSPRSYGQDQGINGDLEGGRYQINLGAQNSQSGEDLSAKIQDSSAKTEALGARNFLPSQIAQLKDGYRSQLLRTGGLRQSPRSYGLDQGMNGDLEGRRYQNNRRPLVPNQLPVARNIQKNVWTSSSKNEGDRESSPRAQYGWLRAIQTGNNQLRNVEAESIQSKSPNSRNQPLSSTNIESSGDAVRQGQNAYGYSELSAKILKVVQSNPSMMSNLGQLLNEQDSGNQQVRELKQLLQQVGRINGNSATYGKGAEPNSLLKSLFDIMVQNGISPVSYQGLQRWRF